MPCSLRHFSIFFGLNHSQFKILHAHNMIITTPTTEEITMLNSIGVGVGWVGYGEYADGGFVIMKGK